ncbi:MAG: protoporphyrinogen oxidase, partial [Candidatus Electrothrix sp. AS4_5]|nr:protoporphyrinogen oxidase [Candidatus Electrothrix gigas]
VVRTGQLELHAKHVVIALPVNSCLDLLAYSELPPPPLAALPEARIINVALGFPDKGNIPFGFGYLAPEKEERFALGALFSSQMFPARTPEGHVLLEALVGGRRHPERLELPDEEMISRVYDDLQQLIDLPDPPVFSRVLRPNYGIPQLEEGYLALLQWRQRLHANNSTLHLCGFGWQGIGINDMHKQAWKMAKRILAGYQEEQEQPQEEVKGVYF